MSVPFIENAIFPTDISDGSTGGPMFVTFVQSVQSGFEQRVAAWPYGRHYYDVQYGVKTPEQGVVLLNFFHSMLGKAYGFRYLDPFDYKSTDVYNNISSADVTIVTSATAGQTTASLFKVYNTAGQETTRPITKPISGTILLEKNTVLQTEGVDYTIDYATGTVTFLPALLAGDEVKCGFHFHVPCRFDIDRIPMSLEGPLISNTRVTVIEVRV